jgi:hypothetical protein
MHPGKSKENLFFLFVEGKQGKAGDVVGRWERIVVPKALGGWGLKNIFLFSKSLTAKCTWRLINTSSLWTRVVHQKYIVPLSILDWVRDPIKIIYGISIIWKAVIKAFELIGNGLAWRIGSGRMVWIGLDPWAGSNHGHLLNVGTRLLLARGGYIHLAQVGDPTTTNIWQQGWLTGWRLRLNDDDIIHWDMYVQALKVSNIHLTDREDELLWDGDPGGIYTPKAGYVQLSVDIHQREQLWWWKKLWKQHCPTKGKIWSGRLWRTKYQLGTIFKRGSSMVRDGVHFAKNNGNGGSPFHALCIHQGGLGRIPNLVKYTLALAGYFLW